jgi:hypothetical protein
VMPCLQVIDFEYFRQESTFGLRGILPLYRAILH